MKYYGLKNKKLNKKGGVLMNQNLVVDVVHVLQRFDRMPKNPDYLLLVRIVEKMLNELGVVKFIIFACPNFKPSALITNSPEKYMPTNVSDDDLFSSRILKIKKLRQALWNIGVPSSVDIFIGDNDFSECINPIIKVKIDPNKIYERQLIYLDAFKSRMNLELGQLYTVWSFAQLGVTVEKIPTLSVQSLKAENAFFEWLFSDEGPYKGMFSLTPEELNFMVVNTFALYGNQGLALDSLFDSGGILLRTGRPKDWLQGTQVFRCLGGANQIAAIYPYIRKEDLDFLGKGGEEDVKTK